MNVLHRKDWKAIKFIIYAYLKKMLRRFKYKIKFFINNNNNMVYKTFLLLAKYTFDSFFKKLYF